MWDFPIQTDRVIEHRRPDTVCIEKIEENCLIIDNAILRDQNIIVKEQEKIEKGQGPRFVNRIGEIMEITG